ncbi:serine/threonine-protein kinase EDR1-like protein [Tanacetum coccineum]|uniref:Serine/threonine-protein kinase EDR1-like protein n=1 Tax=Tanacetum coccineum TaxID=301880 RepID=A0ABQ5C010_9ASTR
MDASKGGHKHHVQYHHHAIQPESNESNRPAETKPPGLNYSIQTGEEFAFEFMRDRVNPRMPLSAPPPPPGNPSLNTPYESFASVLSVPSTNTTRDYSSFMIKILCSFGGKILPRPSDGKLRYVGGDTRIIRIRRDISWRDLWQKAVALYNETCSIKYQLPGEDLDALVSVSCDEDLQNMMEECNLLGDAEASKKLRMFLFSLTDLDDTHFGLVNSGGNSDVQFLVAVNGLDIGSRTNLNVQNADDMNISNNVPPLADISSSMPVSMPPNSSGAYENHNQMQHAPVPLSSSDNPSAVQLNYDGLVGQQQSLIKKPVPEVEHGLRHETAETKMTEERHQDSENASYPLDGTSKDNTRDSNDNDSYASKEDLPYGVAESDLIDLSYLEPPVPPPRVYHSERIPRGQTELNRLTKSDDSLGSQFILTHSRSDVGPQEFISEDRPSQNDLPPISAKKPSRTNPRYHNEGNNNKQSGHETNNAAVNDNNPKFNKPAETKAQFNLSQQATGDSTANNAQSSAPNDSRTEQGDIIIDVNDRFPRDFLSDIFTRAMMSEDTPGIDVLPQDGAGMSLNIANHEPQHWSYFQKLARDDFPNKEASHIDQNQLAFSSGFPNIEDNAFVNDEAKDAAPVAGSGSVSLQSHYDPSQVKISESMQFVEMVENIRMPDSEYEAELGNVGMLPSLEDLDISSLQIIRNEDLEELRELGSGTFGTVYHGKWRGTDVAIKRIKKSCFAGRSSEQERLTIEFWSEADILSKLHHPNVVAFYGVVRDGPGATLATVTEFMVDGSLRHVLQRKDRHLDHRRKLVIAMDAAFGMEYLHSKNIVHFDLKCDNLLVNMKDPSRPICKVGDFGLSKIKRNTLVSGGVRGTLPWMAPELLNGSSTKVSEKVDVFSFGIVLWEILTGEEPYANMHYGAIIGGIVSNTLRPLIPKDCDGEWRRLMELCWSPNPMLRPSFTEITNKLRVMSHTKTHAHKAARGGS